MGEGPGNSWKDLASTYQISVEGLKSYNATDDRTGTSNNNSVQPIPGSKIKIPVHRAYVYTCSMDGTVLKFDVQKCIDEYRERRDKKVKKGKMARFRDSWACRSIAYEQKFVHPRQKGFTSMAVSNNLVYFEGDGFKRDKDSLTYRVPNNPEVPDYKWRAGYGSLFLSSEDKIVYQMTLNERKSSVITSSQNFSCIILFCITSTKL